MIKAIVFMRIIDRIIGGNHILMIMSLLNVLIEK